MDNNLEAGSLSEKIGTRRPGSGEAVGTERYTIQPPKAHIGFKERVLRTLVALGIIGAGSFQVAKGVEQIRDAGAKAIQTAGEIKNQIGLLSEQKSALALYEKYRRSNPEKILHNMIVVNSRANEPVNGRNMPDVEKQNSIVHEIPVGTILGDVIEVSGIDADLLPDIRTKLRQSDKPEDKQRLMAKWYFVITDDAKDGYFIWPKFVKKADLADLNPLNKNYLK